MRTRAWGLAVGAACALTVGGEQARANEKEHHLGIGGGLGILKIDDKSTASIGPGLALHYAYQVTDAFRFMTEFSSTIVAKNEIPAPDVPRTRPTGFDAFGIGVGYVLDVTRNWAPYGGVMASGTALTGGTLDKPLFTFGVQLAVGVDYMLTSHFAIGIALREHLLLTEMSKYPSFYSGYLRAEFVWGR